MGDEPRPSGGVFLCLLLAVSSHSNSVAACRSGFSREKISWNEGSRLKPLLQAAPTVHCKKKGAAEAAPESKDCFLALLLEFHFVFEAHLVFEFHLVCNDNVVGVFHALCFDCHAQL